MENDFESLASLLSDAIRAKGISIEKLSNATGVSEHHIELLLESDAKKLPASPYLHGYIVKLGDALGMDGETLWQTYTRTNINIRKSGAQDALPRNRFETTTISKKYIVFGIVGILIIIYVVLRMPFIVGRPELIVANISENMVVENSLFTIEGRVSPSDRLTINGEIVYPEQDGSFAWPTQLEPGFNTFTLVVKRSLGKEVALTKQIFLKTATITDTEVIRHNGTE